MKKSSCSLGHQSSCLFYLVENRWCGSFSDLVSLVSFSCIFFLYPALPGRTHFYSIRYRFYAVTPPLFVRQPVRLAIEARPPSPIALPAPPVALPAPPIALPAPPVASGAAPTTPMKPAAASSPLQAAHSTKATPSVPPEVATDAATCPGTALAAAPEAPAPSVCARLSTVCPPATSTLVRLLEEESGLHNLVGLH